MHTPMRYASSGGGVRFRRRKWAGVLLIGAAVCFLLLVYVYGHHGATVDKKGHSKSKHHKSAHIAAPLNDGSSGPDDGQHHMVAEAEQRVATLPPRAEDRVGVETVAPPPLAGEVQHGIATKDATIAKPRAIVHTDHGDVAWELFPDDAPKTVANFVRMSREGVFNQSCFYRYEKGFVLQGGLHCNKPPPHHGKAKNVPLEYKRRNEKYTVALARAGGDLNSGGTEFFINLRDNSNTLGPGKKGGYAVFAAVVDGMDTIAALKKLPTKVAGLTRFVSPQPQILWIEIQNYVAPAAADASGVAGRTTEPVLAVGRSKKKVSLKPS